MNDHPDGSRKYRDADGYDSYMGEWSAALSPLFLKFVGIQRPARVIDVGCGTGNLLVALSHYAGVTLLGVDPSSSLLSKARGRPELARATLLEGYVEQLPVEAKTADYTLSMLVLQEFHDRPLALGEMGRVTRHGGVVAACQWDFARMPVIDALVNAIERVSPSAGSRIAKMSPRVFADEAELLFHWDLAGFRNLRSGRIAVRRTFQTFEHLWQPLLSGSTPSTLTLASLPSPDREAIRTILEGRFAPSSATDTLEVTAEALVVCGSVGYDGGAGG